MGIIVLHTRMFQEAIRKYNEQATQPFTPKVVLFDMDGVLYDSMPNHAKAWQRAMAEFGIHFTAEDSYATEGARGVDTVRRYAKEQLGTGGRKYIPIKSAILPRDAYNKHL